MSLKKYQRMRKFKETPEPKGKNPVASKNIFVIQKHAASHLHYDLRLASRGVLKSWAVPKGPCLDPSVKRLAVEVEDHPLEYANFEGSIPKGHYGGGEVIVWDKGTWESDTDLEKSYRHGSMHFILKGKKLHGEWKLVRMKTTAAKPQWLLIKADDRFSKKYPDYDITLKKPKSVLSGKKIKSSQTGSAKAEKHPSIKKTLKKLPLHFKPELAHLSKKLPEGQDWLYEEKYDGYRILAFIDNKEVRLLSRNNHDWTQKFASIADAIKKLKLQFTILDGEVVVLDKKKRSNFQLLQNAFKEDKQSSFRYFVFDIPYYQGHDINVLTLLERKKLLKKIFFGKKISHIHLSPFFVKNAAAFYGRSCQKGLEGIMAKDKNSPYRQARTHEWLKIKCHQGQEFIVIGFTNPEGDRKYFGSLLLAYYDDKNQLVYCGHVGTGFNQHTLKELYLQLKRLIQSHPPRGLQNQDRSLLKSHWVKPRLVVEIKFTEWTQDGLLRHPSYQGLRRDKKPQEVKRESPLTETQMKKAPSINSLLKENLSHPDKILFPEMNITKLDLANYYLTVAEKMLPFIIDRPLTLLRCPHPGKSKCFFQKNWREGMPEGLQKIPVTVKHTQANYVQIHTALGLVGAAQFAIIELHPWSSKLKKIHCPDQIILDLDPDPSVSWVQLIEAVFLVRDTFTHLELKSYAKLTGGKGIHVVVPIKANQTFIKIKEFSRLLAEKLTAHFPTLFTATMSKKERVGKIFLDYLRNEEGATAIAPFSPRANSDAAIAVPVSWKKLEKTKRSRQYSIATVNAYFADYPKNPWEDFFTIKQSISVAHLKALKNL